MTRREPATSARDRLGRDALDLLAEALFARLDEMVSERLDSLAPSAAEAPEERWLTVNEVAERIGASSRTVYRALRTGALVGERLGAHWRIRPEAVAAWLAAPPPERPAPASSGNPSASPRRDRRTAPPPTTFMARARQRQKQQQASATTSPGATAPPNEEER